MSPRQSGTIGEGARRAPIARRLFRGRVFLMVMVPLVALAMALYVLPKASSKAANLEGVQYEPGTAQVNKNGDSCQVQLPVTATAPDESTAAHLSEIVSNDSAKTGLSGTSVFLSPGPLEGTKVYFSAFLDGISCDDVGEGGTAETIDGNDDGGADLEKLPVWAKIAIGGLAAAAIFVGVTIAVGIGIEAAIGAGAATTATGAALSGCVGGAVSTAANNLITGAAKTSTDNVSSAVVGCLTGGITAQLGPYLKPLSEKLGKGLRAVVGLTTAEAGGPVLEEVAIAAEVDVHSPMVQMTTGAAQGAESVASS